ncbi:MAG: exodeoxyribonuclease VII large subunit, partial [Gemmatimonadota bacterium]|nr:exodeoxyribonuclease VII large subunit [Gemmatimonadota bacterium]
RRGSAPRRGTAPSLFDGAGSSGAPDVALRDAAPGEVAETAIPVEMLTQHAKTVLEGAIPPIWIRGEVSGFKRYSSGHWYFTLKDAKASLPCVVWAGDTYRIPAMPDDGMQVMARGQLTVYPAQGKMQFIVRAMEAEGEGLWRKAFEATKARLAADGLLDPATKRELPRFPRRVAVVTSPEGAALQDIKSVIARRNPSVDIIVVPAAVQGETAPASLVAALQRVARWGGADVVIVGRGGGSREDLWAFNDEQVARAIAACPIPTISAVGHEIDVTIADLVADVRAATPSAAAEAAVPVLEELVDWMDGLRQMMTTGVQRRVVLARRELRRFAGDLSVRATRSVERRRARVQQLAGRLDALSPLNTLARGYGVARNAKGQALGSVAAFAVGDEFHLVLRDGQVDAKVNAVRPGAPPTAGGAAR